MIVNEQIAIDHGLKSEEYKKICKLLKRTPNITELGIFSAMWKYGFKVQNNAISYRFCKIWRIGHGNL